MSKKQKIKELKPESKVTEDESPSNESQASTNVPTASTSGQNQFPAVEQCPICLNPIQELSLASGCMHRFCRVCLVEWSKRSNQCPVCRTTYSQIFFNIKSENEYEILPVEAPTRQFRHPFMITDGSEFDFEPIHRFLQTYGQFRPMGALSGQQQSNPNQIPNMNGVEISMVRETRDPEGNLVRMNRVFFIPEDGSLDSTRNLNPNLERRITPVPFNFPATRSFLRPPQAPMNAAEGPSIRRRHNRQPTIAEEASNERPRLSILDSFPIDDEFGQLFRSFQEWLGNMNQAQANVERVLSQSNNRPQSPPAESTSQDQSAADHSSATATASRRRKRSRERESERRRN